MRTAAEERFQRIQAEFRDQFKDHVATRIGEAPHYSHIRWKKPTTMLYRVDYTIINRALAVTGDLGDAIYEWSSPIKWRRVSLHDFSYFVGKCRAWTVGDRPDVWDTAVALDRLVHLAAVELIPAEAADALNNLDELESPGRWIEWVYQKHGTDGVEALGDLGRVPHARAIAHWLGLKMAVAQLIEAGEL